MTDAELKKWRWMKPTAIALSYTVQYPLAFIVSLPFIPLILVCYGTGLLSDVFLSICRFLTKWIAYKPLNTVAKWAGFYELAQKARKEQK